MAAPTGEGCQPGDGPAKGLQSPYDGGNDDGHGHSCAKADGLLGEETESGGNTRSEARPNDETDGSVPIQ